MAGRVLIGNETANREFDEVSKRDPWSSRNNSPPLEFEIQVLAHQILQFKTFKFTILLLNIQNFEILDLVCQILNVQILKDLACQILKIPIY